MAVINKTITGKGTVLKVSGAFTAATSLAFGLFFLLGPAACSAVAGFQLVIWGTLFLAGVLAFIIGAALSRR